MTILQRTLAVLLCFFFLLSTTSTDAFAQEEYASLTDSELDALVAPVALYRDALLAQVLGGATYPDQVVDADNFLKGNPSLQGDALASAVEAQGWDPAFQALTQFPSVLANMAKNITWTSSLGDASATQQQAVMAAVQRLRAGESGGKSQVGRSDHSCSRESASDRDSAGEFTGCLCSDV